MSGKLKCGVLGATGMVGQQYVKLLQGHPWFEVVDLAASPRSAGRTYGETAGQKWQMDVPIPGHLRDVVVRDATKPETLPEDVDFVFSAIAMETKEQVAELEMRYAQTGVPVVSNNSAHRWTKDVPVLVGEINPGHVEVIPIQKRNRGFDRGFVVVKPNCSLQSFLTPVHALNDVGYRVSHLVVTTLQAASGAGYPGVPSLDLVDNIVPFIGGEEDKTEREPLKILGRVEGDGIALADSPTISSTCTRVPVVDGHTAVVNLKFEGEKPSLERILEVWAEFHGAPQEWNLPFAPEIPIRYLPQENRPQPRKDRDADKGMAVTVGRLRKDRVFDVKFVGLSHNTVRGAAGGGILNAELLKHEGFLE